MFFSLRPRRSAAKQIARLQGATLDQFRSLRWPAGVACIWCQANTIRRHAVRANGVQRYRCAACKKLFSDTSRTFLEGSKIPFDAWYSASSTFMENRSISARSLQRLAGVSYPTARRMLGVFQRMARVKELEEKNSGGGDGSRTHDLGNANAAL